MKSKYILSAILTLVVVLLWGCKPQGNTNNSKPTIMVTIEPLRYFTETIVQDDYNVVSMVPKGSSPETYDPTPQQLIAFSKSQAYIKIGYIGFEISWMTKLLENSPELKVVDSSVGLDLIYGEAHQHGDHFHVGGVEPHTWNSTTNARIIAKNILDGVISLNPIRAEVYKENYKKLLNEINHTEQAINNLLNENKKPKGFMIYHPALSYFARDNKLTQVSIEEDGKEPTPAHLKNLIKTCRELDIDIIFIQPEFDKKNAEVIAKETNSKIIPINPLAYEWSKELIKTTKALVNNQ